MKIRSLFPFLFPLLLCLVLGCLGVLSMGQAEEVRSNRQSASTTPSTVDHTSAQSLPHQQILAISARIDELVLQKLEEQSIQRGPKIDDETFVRRIYVDVVGRIPTLTETTTFLASRSKHKRANLIDELLDSYGHVSHQYNFWADLLRVKSLDNGVYGQPYIEFIKDSIESNMPYDQFVYELLTAQGQMLGEDSGATGYYLRDLNMPEDNMSNTVRVFLGTRLECAQCHDHPYDKWTQRDYFEMVAFTGGITYRSMLPQNMSRAQKEELKAFKQKSGNDFAKVRKLLKNLSLGVYGSGTGLARLPEGFLGDDGEENEIVSAKTLFEKEALFDVEIPADRPSRRRSKKNNKKQRKIPNATEIGSRVAYARWLIDSDNPRFAKTIANRFWKQAFGRALIEPVDVIEDHTEASNEPLLDYLTQTTVDLGFDLKQLQRAIYNSRTYQSAATSDEIGNPQTYAFNGPIVRRMSAEQIWDSLLALTLPNIDRRSESDDIYLRRQNISPELVSMVGSGTLDLEMLVDRASADSNRTMMMEQRAQRKSLSQEMRNTIESLNRKIRNAQRDQNPALAKALMVKRADKIQALKSSNAASQFKRASELRSPARPGHFLQEFGQSDRDQIENANTDPAVPQVLSMMNGMIEKQIVKDPNTVLMSNILQSNRPDRSGVHAIETVYLTMLSRKPTRKEQTLWQRDFRANFKTGYGDLIWTLANSNEFIFIK